MEELTQIGIKKPTELIEDPLTEIIRRGTRRILQEALELEIQEVLEQLQVLRLEDGTARVVRNGYHPERSILTGVGPIPFKMPKARDRSGSKELKFSSRIIPPYLRKSPSMEAFIPWLYLKGISTGDFSEALAALVGPEAKGLSATTISRLKAVWQEEFEAWSKRDLSKKRYAYFWADGVYSNVRMSQEKQCLLVIVGVTDRGKKELVALEDGYRESEQSWTEVLLDLKRRGLEVNPKLAIGDGSMGFWKALRKLMPSTEEQRCWMHKTGNVLNALPKGEQPKAKQRIQEIWMAGTKAEAEEAFDFFVRAYGAKFPKAVDCLAKDRETLMTFYDFPAEHWKHIRTTNPIESTFATVRLRTAKVRGCFSRDTVVTMAFKLMCGAEKRWRTLNGFERLAQVIEGVRFVDGIEQERIAA